MVCKDEILYYDYFNRACYINLKLNITQSKCFSLKHRTEKNINLDMILFFNLTTLDIVGQMVFRNVNYCIIEEIFPCVACGDSFQCVFNYCTLFSACLTTTDAQKVVSTRAIFVSEAILQHKSLLKERPLVEMINLKR